MSAPAGYDLVLLDQRRQPIGTLARAVMSRRLARKDRKRKALLLGVPARLIQVRAHDDRLPCDLIDRPPSALTVGALIEPSFEEIARIKREEDR